MTQTVPKKERSAPYILSSVSNLISDLKAGRPVIIVDDENRENEGDLVIASDHVNEAWMTFMIRNCSGIICLAIDQEQADRLNLPLQPRRNVTDNQARFTVSIEAARNIETGVSASDRVETVRVASNPASTENDIATPGHIFPLIGRKGGVLERAGHTEASIDLMRLAGLNPAAVICEVMNEDGTMARLPELMEFAGAHNLKIGSIEDLTAYLKERQNNEF